MPWISAKDLTRIMARLDELEKFKKSTETEYNGLYSLDLVAKWGWEDRIKELEYEVAFLKKSEYGLDGAVGPNARKSDSPVTAILLKLKERQDKEYAAQYRELPEECKNGHGKKAKGGKG